MIDRGRSPGCRYGVIADVHGNLEALGAVLDALDRIGVDKMICLGDIVGYNGESNECIAEVRARGVEAVAGNHDLIAIDRLGFDRCAMRPSFSLRRTRKRLWPESRRYLETLPPGRVYEDAIALIHGGVDDVSEYMTTPALIAANARRLRAQLPRTRICLFGHTHVPKLYEQDDDGVREQPAAELGTLEGRDRIWFINPGSVDAARRTIKLAEFAVLDTAAATVAFHSVRYDHEKVERSAAAQGYRMSRTDEALYISARWLRQGERRALRLWREAIDLARI